MMQPSVIEPSNVSENVAKKAPKHIRTARWLFISIVIVNIVIGSGLWTLSAWSSAKAATADLRQRLAVIENMGGPEVILDQNKRSALRSNLDAVHRDLVELEGIVPLGGRIGPTTSWHHALRMADDLVSVGQHAIAMGDILGPSFQVLIKSVSHPVAEGDQIPAGALTESGLAQVISELHQAQAAWQMALDERKGISRNDLDLLPVKSISKYLDKLDHAVPLINRTFATGATLVPQLHTLLGITTTERVLLFDMDSDELRPTGGFLGNYGVISLSRGVLSSRISLHDTYTLDCANGCPARAFPSEYSWFLAGKGYFGMRDSNLDPDLPHSAALIEHMFRLEGGPSVDGVVLITPALVAHLLDVTGPLVISQFHETITAANLRDKLHYYHQNPQIGEQLGVSATALGTSKAKVFDVLLSRALIAKLSQVTPSQLLKLLSVAGKSLLTKDLQVYSNIPAVEGVLREMGYSSEVLTAPDSLFVVDTNDSGGYANADLRESYVDHITLDAQLGAQHSLTITYTYPMPSHSYRISYIYRDFVRVIIPANAQKATISGNCTRVAVKQPGHAVLGCRMELPIGQKLQLTFKWYTPPPPQANAAPSGQPPTYELLIQRQAGAILSAAVTVSPPQGSKIAGASVASVHDGIAQWTATPFTSDEQITVTMNPN